MSKKLTTMIEVFDSIFKDYSWFKDQEQYEIHLGRFSRGFMAAYNELQSTITAQADMIQRLKEDGERLAKRWWESHNDETISCQYCGLQQSNFENNHKDDCPITLHTDLMNSLEGK